MSESYQILVVDDDPSIVNIISQNILKDKRTFSFSKRWDTAACQPRGPAVCPDHSLREWKDR